MRKIKKDKMMVKRYNELLKKQERAKLSPKEIDELENLEETIEETRRNGKCGSWHTRNI